MERVLQRASEYFMTGGDVGKAALAIARILTDEGIEFAIAGALACGIHGHERMTSDVDVLITREGLSAFKERWLGRGYLEVSAGLKAVRDTQRNIKIDFLIAGDYPGDGQPKPIVFPNPAAASAQHGSLRVLALPRLLELKLASGMTAPHRLQDLADVIKLIRANDLDVSYADELSEYVRPKFRELHALAQIEDDY